LLPSLLEAPADTVGWRIARRPYLIGYGYTPDTVRERKNLRLIRKGRGAYDLSQKVHEGIVPDGTVGKAATGSLLHYRPLVLDEQILKENKYSTLKADQQFAAGKPPRPVQDACQPAALLYTALFSQRVVAVRLSGLHRGCNGCGLRLPDRCQDLPAACAAAQTEFRRHGARAPRQVRTS
jgi:hypothetical protein